MNLKEFFARHIRGWFPEDHKMPENMIHAIIGRYYLSTRLSDFTQFLSNISIGIGLSFSSMVVFALLRLEFFSVNDTILTVCMGTFLFALGCGCFYMYKKIFKFDSFPAPEIVSVILSALLTFALMSTAQITGFFSLLLATFCFLEIAIVGIHRNNRLLKICSAVFFSIISFFVLEIFVLHMLPSFFPFLFAASGFLAVGIVGISRDVNCRKLGFCFMFFGSLFLVCVPIVNIWQIQCGYGNDWSPFYYSPIYNVFTIPLILVSVVFFVLGTMLIIYKRSPTIRKHNLVAVTVTEQENCKQDSTGSPPKETNVAKKVNITSKSLGFSFVVLSQVSLFWAATTYTQDVIGAWGFSTQPSTAFPFIVLTVALFTLGTALMLYRKSNKPGFFGVATGSIVLLVALFAFLYETQITELMFGYLPVSSYINPYREFTQPLLLASIPLFAVGYILMLKKPRKIAATEFL